MIKKRKTLDGPPERVLLSASFSAFTSSFAPRTPFPLSMSPCFRSLLCLIGAAFAVSCTSQRSHITDITDLPLKSTKLPTMAWQVSPIRSHAQYALFGAQSNKERRARLGDYYFVNWYDADNTRPVKLEMLYTQAITASQVLSCSIDFTEPRPSPGSRKSQFFFNGPDRAKNGDIMTWRINLYVDGDLVDSRHSYLWQDSVGRPEN